MYSAMDPFFSMGTINMGVHDQGDSEMGGGPTRVSTKYRTIPDGNQLKGQYEVIMEEWKEYEPGKRDTNKHRDTRFRYLSEEKVIHQLDGMMSTLQQCAYVGSGVKTVVKDNYGNTLAGFTSAMTGENPRGVLSLPQGSSGVLASSRCLVDTDSGDDHKLYCERPDTRNTKFDLINKLDKKADEWADPNLKNIDVLKIESK